VEEEEEEEAANDVEEEGGRMDKNPDVADDEEGDNSNGNMTIHSSKAIEGIDEWQTIKKTLRLYMVNKTTNSLLVLESALQWITGGSKSALPTSS